MFSFSFTTLRLRTPPLSPSPRFSPRFPPRFPPLSISLLSLSYLSQVNGFINDHELDGQVDSFQQHLSDGPSLVEQMGNLDAFFTLDDADTMQLLESAYFAEKARIARRPDILQLGQEKLEQQLKVQRMARMFQPSTPKFGSVLPGRLGQEGYDNIEAEMKAGMEFVVNQDGLNEKEHHSEGLDDFEDSSDAGI